MTEPWPGGITSPQEWLDGLVPKLPNLGEDAIKFEILTVLRDFFKIGKTWRDWIGPITLHPDEVYYSAELTDYKADLVDVLYVRNAATGFDLRVMLPEQQFNIFDPGTPSYFHQTPEGMIQIWPPPAEEGVQVYAFCTMMPMDLCVPDWIKIQHFDDISAGVLARWMLAPGPNFNFQLGNWWQRRYRNARNDAQLRSMNAGSLVPERAGGRQQVFGSQRSFGARNGVR